MVRQYWNMFAAGDWNMVDNYFGTHQHRNRPECAYFFAHASVRDKNPKEREVGDP